MHIYLISHSRASGSIKNGNKCNKYNQCWISGATAGQFEDQQPPLYLYHVGSDEVETKDSQCSVLLDQSNLFRKENCKTQTHTKITYHVQSLLISTFCSIFHTTVTYSKAMPVQFAIVGQFGGQQPPFKFSDGRENSHQLDINDSDMDLKFSSQFRSF